MANKPFDFKESLAELAPRAGIKHPEAVFEDFFKVSTPFVVASINYGRFQGIGIAKCGSNDTFNPDIGKRIALARALRDAQQAALYYYV
jgi:hypothetical protein